MTSIPSIPSVPSPPPKKEWPKHPRVSIAVLVPVLGRPQRVKPLIESLRQSTDEATIYFIANESDREEVDAIRKAEANLFLCEGVSWAKKINFGFANTVEPWMLLGADDLKFHSGWVDRIRMNLVSKKAGVVGTNDGGNVTTFHGAHSTHPLVSRNYAMQFGTIDGRGICCEQYHHNYVDNEIVETAKLRGQWVHEKECLIEHLHPIWGKAPHDATYIKGRERIHEDCALFAARSRRFGFR